MKSSRKISTPTPTDDDDDGEKPTVLASEKATVCPLERGSAHTTPSDPSTMEAAPAATTPPPPSSDDDEVAKCAMTGSNESFCHLFSELAARTFDDGEGEQQRTQ
jgi:hypothetical protein